MADENREHGVQFGPAQTLIDGIDYPVGAERLTSICGDVKLRLPESSVRVADLVEESGIEEFESAQHVREAVLAFLGDEALKHPGYSDRDPPTVSEPDVTDEHTF